MTDKTFSSKDLPLVAYLHAKGHKIDQITDRDNFNRISFVFPETKKLLTDLYDYQKDKPIPVQTYYRSLSHIWNLIKQNNDGGKHEKAGL